MTKVGRTALALLASLFVVAWGSAFGREVGAATATVPFITGVDEYIAVPGSKKHASPRREYRAVFDARRGAAKPDEVIPTINMIGSELNTLAAHRVPRSKVKFAIVFHTTPSNEAVLTHAAYRVKYGIDNPNLAVIRQLKSAGVGVFVCGQSLVADHVELSNVHPDVTIVEDGIITIMEHANDGYAQFVF